MILCTASKVDKIMNETGIVVSQPVSGSYYFTWKGLVIIGHYASLVNMIVFVYF